MVYGTRGGRAIETVRGVDRLILAVGREEIGVPPERPMPRIARIRRDGPLVELINERGEAILSVVLGRAPREADRRVIARLIREGRARGYQVEMPEGFLG